MSGDEDAGPRSSGLLQDWHRYSAGAPTWKAVLVALIFDAGFLAVFLFRFAQREFSRGRKTSAQLARRLAQLTCSAELNPGASVGPGLYLPHPCGVTIGRGCRLGRDVTLYQGVTLGARTVASADAGEVAAYPEVLDGATLYAHALVYGRIRVGVSAVVLGNSVVSADVPDGALVGGIPARDVRPSDRAAD